MDPPVQGGEKAAGGHRTGAGEPGISAVYPVLRRCGPGADRRGRGPGPVGPSGKRSSVSRQFYSTDGKGGAYGAAGFLRFGSGMRFFGEAPSGGDGGLFYVLQFFSGDPEGGGIYGPLQPDYKDAPV